MKKQRSRPNQQAAADTGERPKLPANIIRVSQQSGETAEAAVAREVTRPCVAAATTLRLMTEDVYDINALIEELRKQNTAINNGDIGRCVETLMSQAQILDVLFHEMARRSMVLVDRPHQAMEIYFRLALKAQTQCRTTLEAIAEIKNPRPFALVQQANIASGHQQVNNAHPKQAAPRKILQNKLLGEVDEKRLDTKNGGQSNARQFKDGNLGQARRAREASTVNNAQRATLSRAATGNMLGLFPRPPIRSWVTRKQN